MTTNGRYKKRHMEQQKNLNNRRFMKEVENQLAQKDHLETEYMTETNDFEKKRKERQDELQQYMYSQSSNFSSVSRYLVTGIMGTVWAITYKQGKITVNHPLLALSMLLCLLYFLCDVIHYYLDSRDYSAQQYELDKYTNDDDLKKHEKIMDGINIRSHRFIVWKFRLLMAISAIFFIGIILMCFC